MKLPKNYSLKIMYIYLYVCKQMANPIYPTPPLGQDMTQGQLLSGV